MNDRELLELAAKAADMRGWQWVESWGSMAEKRLQGGFYFDRYWNPLEDDGDALRLAVNLHLACSFEESGTLVEARDGFGPCAEEHDYRRAIVRAAAEIGKNMNEH